MPLPLPMCSVIAQEKDIRASQAALRNPEKLDAETRKAHQNMVAATVHPASGEIIPWAVRVSGIAPVNIPLIFAMLAVPATNIPATLFLHWVNQSYNAVTNYSHRRCVCVSVCMCICMYAYTRSILSRVVWATLTPLPAPCSGKDFDLEASLKAYGLAVGSACSLAYGLGKAYEKVRASGRGWGA